jgi:uncharacterized protein (UPF0264 family)
MTLMLASVANCFEVDKLLTAGVDIIDVKDPVKGALGALPFNEVREIVKLVNYRCPVSATIGDITSPRLISPAITEMAGTGVNIVKAGVFNNHLSTEYMDILVNMSESGIAIVLVFFADIGYLLDDIRALSATGVKGVMLDTANKSSGSLLSLLDGNQLADFVRTAHEHQLLAGLAGSSRLPGFSGSTMPGWSKDQ